MSYTRKHDNTQIKRSIRRFSKRTVERDSILHPSDYFIRRPITREECDNMKLLCPNCETEVIRSALPKMCSCGKLLKYKCPFVSCKYHLYLDVTSIGSLTLNHPDKEVFDLDDTCLLDATKYGERTLSDVGKLMNLTYDRIRQIQNEAFEKLKQEDILCQNIL